MSLTDTAARPAPDAPGGLLARFLDLKDRQPKLRARDAADALGVSEAELLAARTGGDIVRLDADWGDVIRALPRLGEIMALTRNDHCVHEKYGRFDKVQVGPGMGLVLDPEIDLRLFMSHWRFGFAVTEEVASGTRSSLQFFDLDGAAVHKVYLTEASDRAAYDALVEEFRAAEQSMPLSVMPLPKKPVDRPDSAVDAAGLLAHWAALQDTHDFFGMLNEFGVGRAQAMRLAQGRFTRALAPGAARAALETASATAAPIMVFVGNPGCIQIHTGPVSAIKPMGPWINVLDPRFNLHLREDRVARAYAVEKPTRDGIVTSLELYDADGFCFCQLFGARKPGQPEREDWRTIVAALPSADAVS